MKETTKATLKEVGKTAAKTALMSLAAQPASGKQLRKAAAASTSDAAKKAARKEKLKAIGSTAMKVAGAVLPEVAGAIPVVGPIAKMVLSTLNDDEWFAEYTSAGATFNELLADAKLSEDKKVRYLAPGMAFLSCRILEDKQSPLTTFKDQYLPVILAHVRKKTDNVLVATESDYWTAFVVASRLYAIYYTLEKYLTLVDDLPTNISNLPALITPIAPVNYSTVKGIADTLANYLQVTIKLPYAWTEYLRWRFGTLFLSDNTGKPGLISYDYYSFAGQDVMAFDSNCTPANIAATIDTLKIQLAATSRAVADIRLAYEASDIRLNVEKRHYDEKEFCLRCNLHSEHGDGVPSIASNMLGTLIYLDSRLDQRAAIQAVTLSNDSSDNWAPIHVTQKYVAWFTPETYNISFKQGSTYHTFSMATGWHTHSIDYDTCGITAQINVTNSGQGYEAVVNQDMGLFTPKIVANSNMYNAARSAALSFMAALAVNALQIHNEEFQTVIGDSGTGNDRITFRQKVLSYDAAIISGTQISSIHRVALRNLFRGDYVRKTAPQNKPSVTEAIADQIELSTNLLADAVPDKK